MKRKQRSTKNQPKPLPKSPEETIAGKMIPVAEAFNLAFEKARGGIMGEPQASACLPPWCHKIADRFMKTIFKTLLALDPKQQRDAQNLDSRNFGRMMGMLLRAGVFVAKEAGTILKREGLLDLSKSQEKKIAEFSGTELLFPLASKTFNRPIRNENQLYNQSERYAGKWIEKLLQKLKPTFLHLWRQPVEEHHKFLCGVTEGFVTFLDSEGGFTGNPGRTNLYLNLLTHWTEITAMQKAEPAKSRRDLQQWLITETKIPISGDEDWFDHLCDEIGLVMKGVGRPANPIQ